MDLIFNSVRPELVEGSSLFIPSPLRERMRASEHSVASVQWQRSAYIPGTLLINPKQVGWGCTLYSFYHSRNDLSIQAIFSWVSMSPVR